RCVLGAVLGVAAPDPQQQQQPQQPAAPSALRQHLHQLLLPPLLQCCRNNLPYGEYETAAARCVLAVSNIRFPSSSSPSAATPAPAATPAAAAVAGPPPTWLPSAAPPLSGPPDLAVTAATRTAVGSLAALEGHLGPALRGCPALPAWLFTELLPPALLAPGDRPTRVRALHLLRTACSSNSGCCPEGDGAAGGGGGGDGGGAAKG
ncbi:hypothetical protein Agub_g14155, partial [Astrephomene gubernaculifera]